MQTLKGRRLEKELATNIYNNTDDAIQCFVPTGSGNMSYPDCDILITTPKWTHAIELKNTAQDRFTIPNGEVDQLIDCQTEHTRTWASVDYNNRELLFVEVPHHTELLHGEDKREWLMKRTPACFNARIGRTGSYITDKPDIDQWNSKQSGRANWRVVVEAIGVADHIEQ